MCTVHQIDLQRSEKFGEDLLSMLNSGALALMVSIGHRTGLFDAMSQMPASTSHQIADKTGLNERYVREWLGAMTVGNVVKCRPDNGQPLFSLPPEHAACLTRSAGADNMAVFTQYLGVMGSVEDKIFDCFKNGGGVSYEEFRRFHDVMAEDSGQSVISSLFDDVLPLVPGLSDRLEQGIQVLDVGCGKGRALLLLAQAYPKSEFTGYDLCQEPIEKGRAEAGRLGLTNVRFEVRDLTTFDEDGPTEKFDLITSFDAIHDQARPDRVLAGIHKSLKPEGTYLMQDISGSSEITNNLNHPLAPFLYTISTMHCMTVSLAQGGMGLGTMWGREKAQEMLKDAGFSKIEIKNLDHDIQNDYYIVHRN